MSSGLSGSMPAFTKYSKQESSPLPMIAFKHVNSTLMLFPMRLISERRCHRLFMALMAAFSQTGSPVRRDRLAILIKKMPTPATHVSVGLLLGTPCGRVEGREDFWSTFTARRRSLPSQSQFGSRFVVCNTSKIRIPGSRQNLRQSSLNLKTVP